MYKNADILSAVLNKWAQPLIGSFVAGHMQALPGLAAIQNKIRSTGWVSPNWSLMAEISPFMESVTNGVIAPMLSRYLSQIDDASIPKMAHSIVDDAIIRGELSLFEGKVVFEREDLTRLKRLLELNLPYNPEEEIIIKTD